MNSRPRSVRGGDTRQEASVAMGIGKGRVVICHYCIRTYVLASSEADEEVVGIGRRWLDRVQAGGDSVDRLLMRSPEPD